VHISTQLLATVGWPFGLSESVAGQGPNPELGAQLQRINMRGDEAFFVAEAAIPYQSLAPSSQGGGQWGSPSQREGLASGSSAPAMEAARFQWDSWARGSRERF